MRRTLFEIDEIPKDLRQYFEEVETKCGAPWKRVVEKSKYKPEVVPVGVRNVDGSRGDKTRKLSGSEYNKQVQSTTTGWVPNCTCGAGEPQPCTVLDPFSGAGTTALVAAKMGRDAIGIELNPEYVEMSRKRIVGEMGMLCEVEVLQ